MTDLEELLDELTDACCVAKCLDHKIENIRRKLEAISKERE
jgi:NTP pyrophosphatase (non-canonical NTP hydrolase)